jgi:hypothetical protein
MSITVRLHPYPIRYPSPTLRFLCHSWWTCRSTPRHTWRRRCDCLLALGQPLSVIPWAIQQSLDLVIKPAPGWKGQVPTLFGVSCRIGRAALWLPVEENPGEYREFALLALFPKQDVEDAPPYVHLGMQFLLKQKGQVFLDCSTPATEGRLVLP